MMHVRTVPYMDRNTGSPHLPLGLGAAVEYCTYTTVRKPPPPESPTIQPPMWWDSSTIRIRPGSSKQRTFDCYPCHDTCRVGWVCAHAPSTGHRALSADIDTTTSIPRRLHEQARIGALAWSSRRLLTRGRWSPSKPEPIDVKQRDF